MLSRLKSLPLTIVLTILIWMYAEAQFTSTRDDVRISVKMVAPSPDKTVRALDSRGDPQPFAAITVALQGPKDEIDRVYQESLNGAAPDDDFNSLAYSVPRSKLPAGTSGNITLDTRDMVNSLRYFREHNVVATAASPEKITVEVDTLERLTKAVDLPTTVAVSHLTISPDQVSVSVPSRVLQEIGGPDKISVSIPPQDFSNLPPETEQSVSVRFRVNYPGPRDERITATPAVGTLAVRVPRRQGVTEVVHDVPVWIAGPPALLASEHVELRAPFVSVTVEGPAATVQAFRQRLATNPQDRVIHAYLDLGTGDLPGDSYSTRTLRIVLPEGLSLQGPPPQADFRLNQGVPQSAPAATGPLEGK
jgi:hypothetical protein